MSALVPQGCAENGDCPERQKRPRQKQRDPHSPGDAGAETAIGQQVIIATVAVTGDERTMRLIRCRAAHDEK
jgi:hypothetical protein